MHVASIALLRQMNLNNLSEEESLPDDVVVLSVDEMLYSGLKLLGWDECRLDRWQCGTNVEQCIGMCGAHPSVVAQVCVDLQTTTVESARIEDLSVDKLHWAFHFLYRYPTETERESTWQKCANTIRQACWHYVDKLRCLKHEKICWPANFNEFDI